MMYNILVHVHSGLRWLVLMFILWAILEALVNCKLSEQCRNTFRLMALVLTHVQLVVGLVLYFISPKVIFAATSMKESLLRFFLVEHSLLMLVAVALLTVGYVKAKKVEDIKKKNRRIVTYYTLALVIMLLAIPWPFRGLGAGWF